MQNLNSSVIKSRIVHYFKGIKIYWSLINTLLSRNRKSTNVRELLINDTVIADDKLIAESFNEYLTNIGTNLVAKSISNNNPCDDPMTDECVGHFPDIRFSFTETRVYDVVTRLMNLKVSKATGMDNMSAKALIYCTYT